MLIPFVPPPATQPEAQHAVSIDFALSRRLPNLPSSTITFSCAPLSLIRPVIDMPQLSNASSSMAADAYAKSCDAQLPQNHSACCPVGSAAAAAARDLGNSHSLHAGSSATCTATHTATRTATHNVYIQVHPHRQAGHTERLPQQATMQAVAACQHAGGAESCALGLPLKTHQLPSASRCAAMSARGCATARASISAAPPA